MSIYKNDKNLLTEVNRMKQIMGVQLINEGWDDIIKAILGISDDGGKKITQEIGDDVNKLSPSLSKIGGKTFSSLSDITAHFAEQGLGDDANIIKWIRSKPEIMDQMAKSSDQIMKQATDKVYTNLKSNQIIPQEELDYLGDILSYGLEDPRLRLSELTNYVGELRRIQDGKTIPNPNLEDLIKQLEDKIELKEIHLANKSKTSTLTSTSSTRFTPQLPDWSTIEAEILSLTGKKLDLTNNPDIALFKDQFEKGQWTETKVIQRLVDYINMLKKQANDTSLSEAERKNAREKLDNVIQISKKIGGGVSELTTGVLTTGKKGLSAITGKKTALGGLLVLGISMAVLYGWDDSFFALKEYTTSGSEACLQDIPGWEDVTLNVGMIDNTTMRNFIRSEYTEDKVCEIPGRELGPDQKIKRFNLREENDIFYVEVVYMDDCMDTIQMENKKGAIPSFVSKRVCGGGNTTTPSTGVTKTKEEFENWAKQDDQFGEDNVINTMGPDTNGVFTIIDSLGDSYSYKWENDSWVEQ